MRKVSAIMCIRNREKTMGRALKSLQNNNPDEIIVIDGNSTDNSISIAKEYTKNIYSDRGQGLGYARQLGAEKSQCKYVAYIDSDTELPNDNILYNMISELEKKNWVAIHAQMVDPRLNKSYWERGEDFHWSNAFNKPGKRKALGTIVCIIRRDIILKHKFDSSFKGAAEDGDFFKRLGEEGYEFGVSNEVAYHYHRASFRDFTKQRIWYGKGNANKIIKYKSVYLFFTPFVIGIYGTIISIYKKKLKIIPFYIIWMLYLFYGTILGFFEICIVKTVKNGQTF